MNIFYLDNNPRKTAQWHGDKHCVKMILETAQMLSTVHHVLAEENEVLDSRLYKPSFISHPCSIWVRENSANYNWALTLLKELCCEFEFRRNKTHATSKLIPILEIPPANIVGSKKITFPGLAMPNKFKTDSPIISYRRYYQHKFSEGIVAYNWSEHRKEPYWLRSEYPIEEDK